jgi:hypothetical protein
MNICRDIVLDLDNLWLIRLQAVFLQPEPVEMSPTYWPLK